MTEEKMSKKKIQGKGMPNFCGPNESKSQTKNLCFPFYNFFSDFQEWLQKQEPVTKAFLKWKTNKYDTRNFIPSYLTDYVDSTVKDQVFN